MANDSNVGTALGSMASVFGRAFQSKIDQEHQEKRQQAELIANLVSGGLQAGTIKNPTEAFQFMLDQFRGGKGKGKKGAGGGQDELPSPLKVMLGAVQGAGGSGTPGATGQQGQPQQGGPAGPPQFTTGSEREQGRSNIATTQAGAVIDSQYTAKVNLARRMLADGTVKTMEEGLERVGLKEPVQHLSPPKPFGKPVPADDVEPGAKTVDGTPFTPQPGNYYQPVIISTPQGPETRYQAGAPPVQTGSILKGMSGALRARVEDRLAAQNINPQTATDDQVTKVLQEAGKAGVHGEAVKGAGADEINELRKLNIELARQRIEANKGQVQGVGPNGQELPIVGMDTQGRPDPGAQSQFLTAFPRDLGAGIKGLADYTINPNTYSARTTKGGQTPTRAQMVEWVKQYDPSYDEKQYPVRQKLESDWSSGKTRDSMVATNTVVKHMQEMYNAAKALAPYTYGLEEANKVNYGMRRRTNEKVRDAIRNFETARDAVALELRKVYSGTSGGSQKEIEDWQRNASTTAPTDEKLAFLKTASNLMFGRINSAVDSYRGTMGRSPKPGLGFTQSSIDALKALGINVDEINPVIRPSDPDGIR